MAIGQLSAAVSSSQPRGATRPGARWVRGVLTPILWALGAIVAIGVVWELIKLAFGVSEVTMPHALEILRAFGTELPAGQIRLFALGEAMAVTMQESISGLLLGMAVGLLMGVASAKSLWVSQTLSPVLIATQTVPLVAIVPPLVILMGEGWFARAVIAALLAFFPVYVAVARAISDTPVEQRMLLRSMGFGWRRVMISLELPRAGAAMAATTRTATALAVTGAIVAELPSGSSDGIALMLLSAVSFYLTDPAALWCAALVATLGGVIVVIVAAAVADLLLRTTLRIPDDQKVAL